MRKHQIENQQQIVIGHRELVLTILQRRTQGKQTDEINKGSGKSEGKNKERVADGGDDMIYLASRESSLFFFFFFFFFFF